MKKLLVKIKVIDQPFIAEVLPQPEKWVKDGAEVFEKPMIEKVTVFPAKWVKDGAEVFDDPNDPSWTYQEERGWKEYEPDTSYTYIPAVEAVQGQEEISHEEIIAQTQGTDEQLDQWLAGDSFKYPAGYWLEYIDITLQVEQEKINAEALAYLASTDWLIVREVETQVPCPPEVKQLRAEARLKVVK